MKDFVVDRKNRNRYRITVKEQSGYTAYCFSTPIYNINTQKLVALNFEKNKDVLYFRGSNGIMSICDNWCVFENRYGCVVIHLDDLPVVQGQDFYTMSPITVVPTLNGLRFIVKGKHLNMRLESKTKQESIRFNSNCFAVMSEKFKPFLTISTLYASDGKGTFLPVEIKYQDKGRQIYDISLTHEIENGSFIFEVNLYEAKLFQDTTVESLHPDKNNAYGAVGFIGSTKCFGEQWLYSRPDFSKIPDLTSERVEKVFLHIPILNGNIENVDVYIPEKRFCSFGSTWNKKINASPKIITSNNNGRYLTIDATSMFTNRTERTLVYNEGLILKKPKGKNNFIAISTGDCYSAPQILEIKFKK